MTRRLMTVSALLSLHEREARLGDADAALLIALAGEAYREGVRDGMANALTSLERLKGEKGVCQEALRLALSRVRASCSNATPRDVFESGGGV